MRLLVGAIAALFVSPVFASPTKPTWEDDIKPVFKEACFNCHSPEKKKGDLDLTTYSAMMNGGETGKDIVPGKADQSLLYKVLTHAEKPYMPPKKPQLPDSQLRLVKQWIDDGAPEAIKITFEDHIKPIFREACADCHGGGDKKENDFDATTYAGILAGSSSGDVVTAGGPEDSKLWQVIAHKADPFMPRKRDKLTQAQIDLVAAWIKGGLLEKMSSKPVAAKPKASIALDPTKLGKPDGPPPMPEFGKLLLDPMVVTKRLTAVTTIAHSPWAPLLAIGGQRQTVLYNTDTREFLGVLPFPEGEPEAINFSRNGQYVLVGGGFGAKIGLASLYEVKTGKRIATVGDEYDSALAADITPDLQIVALGGPSRLIKGYSQTGELKYSIKKHTDWVTALAFSPDGKVLASGDRNGGVALWEAANGEPLYDLTAHKGEITAITWRGDGRFVATASLDGTIKIWDAKSAEVNKSLPGHSGGTTGLRYTHDGRLVSSGKDKTVKVWGPDGSLMKTMGPMPDQALSAAFSHDGKTAFASDFLGNVFAYSLEKQTKIAEYSVNPPALADQIVQLKTTIATMKSKAQSAATDKPALAAKIKTASDALAALQKQANEINNAPARATQLEKQIKAVDTALEESRKKHAPLKEAVTAAEQALAKARKAQPADPKAIAAADAAFKKATQELENRRKTTQARADESKQLNDDLKKQRDLAKNGKAQLETLNKQVADATKQIEGMNADLKSYDTLAADIPAAEARLKILDDAQPFARMIKAQQLVATRKADLDKAEQTLSSAEQALSEANAAVAEVSNGQNALAAQLKPLTATLDKANKAVTSAKVTLTGIADARDKAENNLKAARKAADEAKAAAAKDPKNAKLAEEAKAAADRADALQKKFDKLADELAAQLKVKSDAEAAVKTTTDEIEKAKAAAAETPRLIAEASAKADKAKTQVATAKKAVEAATARLAEAEKVSTEATTAYNKLHPPTAKK